MSSGYFSLILREHGAEERARSTLLSGTGLSEQTLPAAPEITLGQQLRQIRNTAHLLDPTWALVTGSRLHPATHGPIGFAAVCAASLRDSLAVMTRFSQVRSPHFSLRAHLGSTEVRLVPEDRVALTADEQRPLLDIVMLSTQAMLEAVLGRPVQEARFELPYAPHDYTSRYSDWFHAPVHFGCHEPAIVFPSRWLSVESPLADPAMFDAALQSLLTRERVLHADRLLVARVEQLLGKRGARLSLRSAAALLGVSSRTLTRRLGGEGTSFQSLLEDSRKAGALHLLNDPELTVAEVAYTLGYEDAANFGRAFRRWFGRSPGQFRRLNDC
jgi:AraC-like DNA-binding protein